MKHDLLCTWLGLADKRWPPDPFLLLGVNPGEKDVARIEQSVHERLCRLRNYQVSHPEEATEGMNCLAQAFILITDSLSREMCKKAVPVTVAVATLPKAGPPISIPLAQKRVSERDDTAVGRKTEVDWQNTPPPVRASPRYGKWSGGSAGGNGIRLATKARAGRQSSYRKFKCECPPRVCPAR